MSKLTLLLALMAALPAFADDFDAKIDKMKNAPLSMNSEEIDWAFGIFEGGGVIGRPMEFRAADGKPSSKTWDIQMKDPNVRRCIAKSRDNLWKYLHSSGKKQMAEISRMRGDRPGRTPFTFVMVMSEGGEPALKNFERSDWQDQVGDNHSRIYDMISVIDAQGNCRTPNLEAYFNKNMPTLREIYAKRARNARVKTQRAADEAKDLDESFSPQRLGHHEHEQDQQKQATDSAELE